ncbi:MAG: ribonuclease H-like domain-containing protein, partial [bacterium]
MNIKEKLRQLESLPYHKRSIQYKKAPVSSLAPIDKVIEGKYEDSPYGVYFCRYKKFPLDYFHGSVQISSYLDKSSRLLSLIGKSLEFDGVDLRKTIFVDTETTGLSGGSGICAFLVGVGYFTEEYFCLAQFFMNDFNEEKALLHQFNQFIKKNNILISFNGKCFDLPLLVSRNIYHQMKLPVTDILHLDLLFTVRRLWKHKLPDCTLGTVESLVLGNIRNGDISSYLIPELYFEYLRNKDVRPLKAIFYHNQQDILSLVALATKACQMFENPIEESDGAKEILSMGKVYERLAKFKDSLELYNQFFEKASERTDRRELLFQMAYNYKKIKNWSKAASIWKQCVSNHNFHPIPFIELAKYFEHKEKNYSKALAIVERALKVINIIEELNINDDWIKYKQD